MKQKIEFENPQALETDQAFGQLAGRQWEREATEFEKETAAEEVSVIFVGKQPS